MDEIVERSGEHVEKPLTKALVKKESKHILVVDDAKAIRVVLSKMLSDLDFQVTVASNGNDGLNLFLRSTFDLVVTDLQMPGIDGLTLASHIKDTSPKTPVVLITGEEKKVVREKIKDSCVDSVLFKPFRLENVEGTIQKMLDKRT